jgi:hypothetical protein
MKIDSPELKKVRLRQIAILNSGDCGLQGRFSVCATEGKFYIQAEGIGIPMNEVPWEEAGQVSTKNAIVLMTEYGPFISIEWLKKQKPEHSNFFDRIRATVLDSEKSQ